MNDFQTNTVPPGIYTVWLEGESGNPYYQRRRVAVPVRIQKDANGDGDYNDAGDVKTTRDFSLINSVLDGSTPTLGGVDLAADLRQHDVRKLDEVERRGGRAQLGHRLAHRLLAQPRRSRARPRSASARAR